MHEIKSDVPPPKEELGLDYWSNIFYRMNMRDHIVIHISEYNSMRTNAARWRKLRVANQAYRFVTRPHPNGADALMVWKVEKQRNEHYHHAVPGTEFIDEDEFYGS